MSESTAGLGMGFAICPNAPVAYSAKNLQSSLQYCTLLTAGANIGGMRARILSFEDLERLLRPILCLSDIAATKHALGEVVGFEIRDHKDIVCQTSIFLDYKGYELTVTDLRSLEGFGVSITVQFRAKRKWRHGIILDQNGPIVRDLQMISKSLLNGLSFRTTLVTMPPVPFTGDDPFTLRVHHDSRAFNRRWRCIRDTSPLLIVPDAHDGKCFIEFQFNPAGYLRVGQNIVLREEWGENASLVSDNIERDVERLLGQK